MKAAYLPIIMIGAIWLTALAGCTERGDGETGTQPDTEVETQLAAPQAASEQSPPVPDGEPASAAADAKWSGNAMNFAFTTTDGQLKYAEDYAGTPLVVNFWAAW